MKISKKMTNTQIAELLRAVGAAYQVKDKEKNKFKIVAYQRAADAVEHLSSEAKDLWDEGKLTEVAGIGESIAKHLGEIFKTGKSKHFEKVMRGMPMAMFELLKVPGIGPKTAYKLASKFKISEKQPLAQLKKLAKEGKIASLEGFGKGSEKEILASVEEEEKRPAKRMILPRAMVIADEMVGWMKRCGAVERVDPLGSLRRKASMVGDVDMAVATKKPQEVIDHFVKYPKKTRVLEKGERTASILIPGEIQVDLMVQDAESYGALLQHFTGSKHHNIALREEAQKRGLSLSEYGIRSLKAQKKEGVLRKFKDEEGFYKALGMSWIAPELREGVGEIDFAKQNKLPKLVELKDVKGDLQIHSDFDIETSHDLGESSMEEVIKKASELRYEYLAFTEHNPSKSGHSAKQSLDILKRKKEVVDKLNYELKNASARLSAPKRSDGGQVKKSMKNYEDKKYSRIKKVFNSLEIDILPDGSLPVDEKGMKTLDFALVSIHSGFRMSREKMTERVLRALESPKAKIFAHPTARKLNFREGVELNWEKIFEACLKRNKWLEINAEPMRLDLPDFLVREAIKAGVRLTLGTDSHHKNSLDNMKYGVFVARRGWATKNDIVNTRGLKELEKMLQ